MTLAGCRENSWGDAGMTVTAATAVVGTLTIDEHRGQLRRALIASTVGTTIEWYDFLLYGTVSALIFGPLFSRGPPP
jgi:hypothetical protein